MAIRCTTLGSVFFFRSFFSERIFERESRPAVRRNQSATVRSSRVTLTLLCLANSLLLQGKAIQLQWASSDYSALEVLDRNVVGSGVEPANLKKQCDWMVVLDCGASDAERIQVSFKIIQKLASLDNKEAVLKCVFNENRKTVAF